MRLLKRLIEKKTSISPDAQRLIYGGKELQDDKTMLTYNIRNASTVHVVLRLQGGLLPRRQLPEGLPHMNVVCLRCLQKPSLEMPCVHTYCSTCVYSHVEEQLTDNDKRKSVILCPVCEREWSLKLIQTHTGASDKEMDRFAELMTENVLERDIQKQVISQCPHCHSYCQRQDKSIHVRCIACVKALTSAGSAISHGRVLLMQYIVVTLNVTLVLLSADGKMFVS